MGDELPIFWEIVDALLSESDQRTFEELQRMAETLFPVE